MDEFTDTSCPHCGEPYTLAVDPSAGAHQRLIEDCPICCRPIVIDVRFDDAGHATAETEAEG